MQEPGLTCQQFIYLPPKTHQSTACSGRDVWSRSSCKEHCYTNRYQCHGKPRASSIINQWPFQDPRLEVPTIYKAYIRHMAYVREYPDKIWPYMVQYLQFRILEFPLNKSSRISYEYHDWVGVVASSVSAGGLWQFPSTLYKMYLQWGCSLSPSVNDTSGRTVMASQFAA